MRLTFRVPKHGSTTLPRVEPEIDLWVDDHHRWIGQYGETAEICCLLDGETVGCDALDSTRIPLPKDLPLGPHALSCEIIDAVSGASLLHPISPVVTEWVVVATAGETVEGRRLLEVYYEEEDFHAELLAWWRGGKALPPIAESERPWATCPATGCDPALVVGVKCAAGAVVQRAAARATWLGDAPAGVMVVRFVVGRVEDPELTAALLREQERYGDLLLPSNGFDLSDGYRSLVPKTKAFARYAHRTFPNAGYAMFCDDDVLVDVGKLLAALPDLPKSRFYAGQVWATHFNQPKLPQRDPTHRNYLPLDVYPMSHLPPFAIGPHYLLSMDCVGFIDRNSEDLAGVGTLEDVSVALWLLALQVHPQHSGQFANARLFGCVEGAVSLADLTARGVRAIHANRAAGRPDCAGYEELAWVKIPRFVLTEQAEPDDAAIAARVGATGDVVRDGGGRGP